MTNDEAIYVLKNTAWLGAEEQAEKVSEAVRMAIEALKAQLSKEDATSDCISRQAAIRIASGYCHPANVAKELAKLPSVQPEPCSDAISREAVSAWLKQYGQDVLHGKYKFSLMYIWKNIMELPSVQPVAKDINVSCKDAISRQDAIDAVDKLSDKPIGYLESAIDVLVDLPSVQPDIIVCADCKHWVCHDKRCGYWNHGVQPMMWCSQAERRWKE